MSVFFTHINTALDTHMKLNETIHSASPVYSQFGALHRANTSAIAGESSCHWSVCHQVADTARWTTEQQRQRKNLASMSITECTLEA